MKFLEGIFKFLQRIHKSYFYFGQTTSFLFPPGLQVMCPECPSTSSDVCAVCDGVYNVDVDDINGNITTHWIQCADKVCASEAM